MSDEYRHEWLGEGRGWHHGGNIGGRSTDLEQIYWSIYHRVRDAFPINEVPPVVAHLLVNLHVDLMEAEATMRVLIDRVSDLRQATATTTKETACPPTPSPA